jgi:superfamily I DNA/RNA helicase
LRLLFVGITRARRDLIVTWNTGQSGDVGPAAAFGALAEWWTEREGETHGDR